MDLYAENILDHFKHPRGKKAVPNPTIEHTETNISCGDSVHIMLTLDGDRIADLGWDGNGCAISQAAMSMLSEELRGKTLKEMDALDAGQIRTLLGVPVSTRRAKCAFLCLHTLKNLIHSHRGEPDQDWAETVAEEKNAK